MLKLRTVSTLLVSATLLCSAQAQAQQPAAAGPPKGFDIKELGRVDLGPEIDGMAGRFMRMTRVTVAPGALMPLHSHKDAPEILYVVEGTLTETRNGTVIERPAGSVLVMTKDITHSLENKTASPAIYIASPIRKQP